MGDNKYNLVTKIYSFKQVIHEIVRIVWTKQYIARSPYEEKPSQKRLISIFLEGLINKALHVHLYALEAHKI